MTPCDAVPGWMLWLGVVQLLVLLVMLWRIKRARR